MLSNSLISILALTSAVSASPALRRRQGDYNCNPAHSYPGGVSCVSTNGALSLVTPAPSPTATYACNPAHAYPEGVTCTEVSGSLTLVTPSPSSTTYACNPAHAYPEGVTCTEVSGSLTLVTPTAGSPTAASTPSATATNCVAKDNTCRSTGSNGLPANQAECASENSACQSACYDTYNKCRSDPNSIKASCASDYSSCLGQNPFDSDGNLTIKPSTAATTTMATSTTAAAPKASGTNAAAPGSDPKKVAGQTWTLQNVNRYCSEDNSGCDYNFDIVANGATEHCTVTRMPGSDAATESWSNQKCANGDYTVSWGYVKNPAPAYAVLTVVDKSNQLAWFGISNVNGQAVTTSPSNPYGSGQYGTVGPEQVYTYN